VRVLGELHEVAGVAVDPVPPVVIDVPTISVPTVADAGSSKFALMSHM